MAVERHGAKLSGAMTKATSRSWLHYWLSMTSPEIFAERIGWARERDAKVCGGQFVDMGTCLWTLPTVEALVFRVPSGVLLWMWRWPHLRVVFVLAAQLASYALLWCVFARSPHAVAHSRVRSARRGCIVLAVL